jgi:hypothetical protein
MVPFILPATSHIAANSSMRGAAAENASVPTDNT